MADLKVINISDLGQLEINETKDVIYLIDKSVNLNIKSGVNAKILDISKNAEVVVNVERDAVINYSILKSENGKRTFNNSGEIYVEEIGLVETDEALNVNLLSENARVESKCLSFASGAKPNFHVYVEHKAKYTYSNVSNIGVALDGGKILFDVVGKIDKTMSKTKCSQLSRGIVMDNNSAVDAKPILLIDEYDCFANHGASIGKVSDEDLFYLMSRGLTKNDACLLILEGIIKPFIDNIPLEKYQEEIRKQVTEII